MSPAPAPRQVPCAVRSFPLPSLSHVRYAPPPFPPLLWRVSSSAGGASLSARRHGISRRWGPRPSEAWDRPRRAAQALGRWKLLLSGAQCRRAAAAATTPAGYYRHLLQRLQQLQPLQPATLPPTTRPRSALLVAGSTQQQRRPCSRCGRLFVWATTQAWDPCLVAASAGLRPVGILASAMPHAHAHHTHPLAPRTHTHTRTLSQLTHRSYRLVLPRLASPRHTTPHHIPPRLPALAVPSAALRCSGHPGSATHRSDVRAWTDPTTLCRCCVSCPLEPSPAPHCTSPWTALRPPSPATQAICAGRKRSRPVPSVPVLVLVPSPSPSPSPSP